MSNRIAIIGGGASGMMAAIIAAENGSDVTIFEHTDRIGKKILVTGNGKCNFTNSYQEKECYYSSNPDFPISIIEQFDVSKTLNLFHNIGLLYKEKNGYFYPISNQAASVLDVLRFQLEKQRVKIITEIEIKSINHTKNSFQLITSKGKESFQKVIIACGGKASHKTGSDGSGYELAKKMGHHLIPVVPALVQLRAKETYFKAISGIRLDAAISLHINEKKVRQEKGELQITDYGISGIPVFQLSRLAAYGLRQKEQVCVHIDCVPMISKEELFHYIDTRLHEAGHLTILDALQGILNKKLNAHFLKLSHISQNEKANKITNKQIHILCNNMKDWCVTIDGTNDFNQCQVCAGGIDTTELTLNCESRLHKGLYFIGEIVDVDGICGGYNLQWAWSSAYVAATHASK